MISKRMCTCHWSSMFQCKLHPRPPFATRQQLAVYQYVLQDFTSLETLRPTEQLHVLPVSPSIVLSIPQPPSGKMPGADIAMTSGQTITVSGERYLSLRYVPRPSRTSTESVGSTLT